MRAAAAVMVALATFGPSAAFAQTEEARFLISASAGFQPGDQTIADDGTFTLYDETGRLSVESSQVAIGAFWDLSVAVRVTRGFTLGAGFHRGTGTDPIEVRGLAPHPVFFNRPRPFELTVDEAQRMEKAVHLSAGYLVPLGSQFDVHLFAGPSMFRYEQEVVDSVAITETGGTFATVNVTPNLVTRKKSIWGGHIGADVSYPIYQSFETSVRLGAFLRYAGASSEFPVVSNTVETDVGGVQYGGGIRFRF
jgi:hypothetical protein